MNTSKEILDPGKTLCIETLTPLWTGDIDRSCSRIKETSIIGSLRWWYEVLVRAEGYACDCTSNTRCPTKDDEGNEIRCDACELFGCTGWSRKFSLRILNSPGLTGLKLLSSIDNEIFYQIIHGKKQKTNLRKWYELIYEGIPLEAFYGRIELKAISNSGIMKTREIENMIAFLLALISRAGGIGAKTQNGFGLIEFVNQDDFDVKEGFKNLKSIEGKRHSPSVNCLPTMKDYLRIEATFPENFLAEKQPEWYLKDNLKSDLICLNIGFAMKFLMRNTFKRNSNIIRNVCTNYDEIEENSNKRRNRIRNMNLKKKYYLNKIVTRSILGSDLDEKWASLIHFSDAYRKEDSYKMRLWGFIPDLVEYGGFKCAIDKTKLIGETKRIIRSNFGNAKFTECRGDEILREVI